MKKLFFGIMLLTLIFILPIPTMAGIDINVNIASPPPIVFSAPPELIVLPGTYIYVAPDVATDIFFYNGWWWQLWNGHWYRSHYYDRGWGYYNRVPGFYVNVDPGWRGYYRDHTWNGHQWNYQRIPNQQLQQNWKGWQSDRHWEKQGTWGVQGYQPKSQQQHGQPQGNVQQPHGQQPKQPQEKVTQPQGQQPKQPQEKVTQPQGQQPKQPQEKVQQPHGQQPKQPQEKVQQPHGQQPKQPQEREGEKEPQK